jgi:hypothetical protein
MHRVPSIVGLAVHALFAVAASAQQLTAHPQETLQNNTGNVVPFGVLPAGNFAEGRTHILVPKDELPSQPAVLTGIEIQPTATANVDYTQLDVSVGPFVGTSLAGTFANNITVPLTPMLPTGPLTIAWTNGAWTPLPTTGIYVHDGSSAMLIEIVKVVQNSSTLPFMGSNSSSSPPRTDRPAMAYAFGFPGSGASTATNANVFANQILYRLVWTAQPTLRHRQDQGSSQNQYALGSTVDLTVSGPAGHLFVLAADVGFLPQQAPIPGIGGALRLAGPVVFAGGLLGAGGEAVQQVGLPLQTAFIGFYLTYQAAVVDPATGGITLTNGTDHFVNA